MSRIEDHFKAAIAATEGKAKEELAASLGYVRTHWTVVAAGIGAVVGFILGELVAHL